MTVSVAPVKGQARMQAKTQEYQAEAAQAYTWPFMRKIGDVVRATVVCSTTKQLWEAWKRIQQAFDVREGHGRLKNNFTLGKLERPPDMLVNMFVKFPGHQGLIGEIQLHYHPILKLKENEVHLMYEIVRAKNIQQLIPKGDAPTPDKSSLPLAPVAFSGDSDMLSSHRR